jgi:hypothetical protein
MDVCRGCGTSNPTLVGEPRSERCSGCGELLVFPEEQKSWKVASRVKKGRRSGMGGD